MQAAPELLELLFRRLELPWYGESLPELERLVEHRYECLLDGDKEGFRDSRETFAHALDRLLSSPLAADGLVLDAMDRNDPTEIPPALEPYLDRRQLAILRVVQNRDVEAVRLLPEAYCYLMAGIAGYEQGSDYTGAMALLQQGYDLAARDGRVRLMLECRMFMGSLCCNQLDLGGMEAHYQAAERMARPWGGRMICGSWPITGRPPRWSAAGIRRRMGIFPPWSTPGSWSCTRWRCAARGWAGPGGSGRPGPGGDGPRGVSGPGSVHGDLRAGAAQAGKPRLSAGPGLRRGADGRIQPLPPGAAHRIRGLSPAPGTGWLTAGRQYKQAYELLRDFPIKLPNLPIE